MCKIAFTHFSIFINEISGVSIGQKHAEIDFYVLSVEPQEQHILARTPIEISLCVSTRSDRFYLSEIRHTLYLLMYILYLQFLSIIDSDIKNSTLKSQCSCILTLYIIIMKFTHH